MRNRAGLGVRKSRRERRVGAGLVEGRVLPRPLGWPDTEQLGAGAGAGASASAPVAAGGGGACGSEGGGSGAAGFLPLHYPWPTASLCRTRGCVTAERVAEAEPVLQTKEQPGTGSSYQISVFAEAPLPCLPPLLPCLHFSMWMFPKAAPETSSLSQRRLPSKALSTI
ncbi:uncharacterized protein LOC121019003 isoform X5 [Herpailurus yagouaroundi]|uniref:uncharacterized protein LOC121019003 isoform X5 n=1 Tax=Herpailurus yagouaroundi TaxID=1608482 RepID=UPI001AD7904D|nr:uncharacterized protein LOC121019003 isoform X5 [Puma yagouaroundi]